MNRLILNQGCSCCCVGICLAAAFIYGLRTYNELIDMNTFSMWPRRLLVEMERNRSFLPCRNAVATYATTEEKIQNHLIRLND